MVHGPWLNYLLQLKMTMLNWLSYYNFINSNLFWAFHNCIYLMSYSRWKNIIPPRMKRYKKKLVKEKCPNKVHPGFKIRHKNIQYESNLDKNQHPQHNYYPSCVRFWDAKLVLVMWKEMTLQKVMSKLH